METSTVINNLEQLANDGDNELLILRLYDLGIQLCCERKKDDIKKVVNALINALNFEYNEIATSFFNLYKSILKMLEDDQFDQVQDLLRDLRATWEKIVDYDSSGDS